MARLAWAFRVSVSVALTEEASVAEAVALFRDDREQLLGDRAYENYPKVDHVHFYGYYIGNYPELEQSKILALCAMLNQLG